MKLQRGRALAALLLLGTVAGCAEWFDDSGPGVPDTIAHLTDTLGADLEVTMFPGAGLDEACTSDEGCRFGLVCTGGRCGPAGDRRLGERCLLSAECAGVTARCANGLNCDELGFCVCAGTGAEGATCATAADCAKGSSCILEGMTGVCLRGALTGGDLDTPCGATADCRAGLVCSPRSETCVPGSLLLNPDLFPGVTCPDESSLPFGVRMRLQREDDPPDRFYDGPFPSDALLDQRGRPDLRNHPRPGPGLGGAPVDPVDEIIRALEQDVNGFSLTPSVYFRFTRPIDETTLRTTGSAPGGDPTVLFVNLADPGDHVAFDVRFIPERNKYQCANVLRVRPSWSAPLRPETTYAVILTTGIRALEPDRDAGESPAPLDSHAPLFAHGEPEDPQLRAAWDSFAPLRARLRDEGRPATSIAAATVFTTGDPLQPTRDLRDLFHGGDETPSPQLVEAVACDLGIAACLTPGLERGRDPRACQSSDPNGQSNEPMEYHALLRMPVFQDGERPYSRAGGAVADPPLAEGWEEVCAALWLPDGDVPANGWPLVIYGHGTGGTYRSAATWAAELTSRGVAILGFDGAMHGPRQGEESWRDPGPLFFNFANPRAARGNVLQGIADNLALVGFATAFEGEIDDRSVRFDHDRISYFGHSQGASTGGLFVAQENRLRGAVFTGGGGGLMFGLLGKTEPYDARAGLRMGFHEVHVDESHPVLALIQWYFEATDPALYRTAADATPEGARPHVLNVFAWDDNYSPWRTGVIFAAALGGSLLEDPERGDCRPPECDGPEFDFVQDLALATITAERTAPFGGNLTAGGETKTVCSLAGRSDGSYDGHFIGERNPVMRETILGFLETLTDLDAAHPTVTLSGDPCPDVARAPCPE